MKTTIELIDDSPYNEYKKGDIGYVDAYIRGSSGIPYAVIVLSNGYFTLVPIHSIKIRNQINEL
jgi:hypothetical protein